MDLTIAEMMQMQRTLQEKHPEWGGTPPHFGKQQLLYAVGEIGEVAEIMKKKGDRAILDDPEVRAHFMEEMGDVWMYLTDVLLCYGISAEDFSRVYRAKCETNLGRDFSDARRQTQDH